MEVSACGGMNSSYTKNTAGPCTQHKNIFQLFIVMLFNLYMKNHEKQNMMVFLPPHVSPLKQMFVFLFLCMTDMSGSTYVT